MSESLYGLLVVLCLLAAYRTMEVPSIGRAAALGALLGLAALARAEALALLVLLLVPVLRHSHGPRNAAVCVTACLVVLAPWTIRNIGVFHRPVVVSTDLASAVAGANCQSSYYGSKVGSWDNRCVRLYPGNEATGFSRDQSDGIHFAESHLERVPVVLAARLARVWGLRRNLLPGSKLPQLPDRSPIGLELGFIMYYVLVALAVFGLVRLRRAGAPVWILLSTFVLVTVSALLVYGDVRFREPAEYSLVVLASVGLTGTATRTGGRAQLA